MLCTVNKVQDREPVCMEGIACFGNASLLVLFLWLFNVSTRLNLLKEALLLENAFRFLASC